MPAHFIRRQSRLRRQSRRARADRERERRSDLSRPAFRQPGELQVLFKGPSARAPTRRSKRAFFPASRSRGKALVSVKGGENVGVGMVRELIAVVEREKAAIGLISLPCRPGSWSARRRPRDFSKRRSKRCRKSRSSRWRNCSRGRPAHSAHRCRRDVPHRRSRKGRGTGAAALTLSERALFPVASGRIRIHHHDYRPVQARRRWWTIFFRFF